MLLLLLLLLTIDQLGLDLRNQVVEIATKLAVPGPFSYSSLRHGSKAVL